MAALSLVAAGRRFRDGSLSPPALIQSLIAEIAALDTRLRSVTTLCRADALAEAARLERALAQGKDRGPLHGIPYLLTDVIDVAGLPTCCGSRLRRDRVAARDARVVERLRRAGAILLGKVATFEFATAPPEPDAPFAVARNPWDPERTAGPNGAGASVAAGFAPLALALDTGGAARSAAALCGVVGLKPSFGRISRRGMMRLADSLDHCGIVAATVEDLARATEALSGFDAADPGSAEEPVPDLGRALGLGVAGLRIGLVRDWLHRDPIAPEVAEAVLTAAAVLERLGARVDEVVMGATELFPAAAHTIYLAEAFALHARDLAAHPELYGRPARERLMAGAFVRGADYVRAQEVRRELINRVDSTLFGRYDLLLAPVVAAPAPCVDAPAGAPGGFTLPFNLTGHPALSLLCGFSDRGLPLAAQIVGRSFDEATMFRAAAAFEAAMHGNLRRPQASIGSSMARVE